MNLTGAASTDSSSINTAVRVKHILRRLSPYVMLELFVPGGTMLALLLWLSRRKKTRPPEHPGQSERHAAAPVVPRKPDSCE